MPRSGPIIEQLRACGVTHVVALPDNTSQVLLETLASDGAIVIVSVTREGEAWAVAAGLWMAGSVPVVLMQNTGFLESGDALRGTAMRMRIPLLCLLTYRGYSTLPALGRPAGRGAVDGRDVGRPDVDSCALLFEPTLHAWGIPYDFVHGDEDIAKLRGSFARAQEREHPVALLITRDTT